jgi:protein-disulfide isomerase
VQALRSAPVEVLQGLDTTIATSAVRGSNAAKFVFIEYSDFQCPFCARYARDVQAPLVQESVDSGQMKYAFKHFPLNIHPFAPKAAEASECAREQGKFWEMHDQLFANQQALAEPDMLRYAQSLGVDRTRFQSCMSAATKAAKVRTDMAEGVRLGARSTPTFFVGQLESDGRVRLLRKITGAQPYATFRAGLQSALAAPAK